MKAARFHETGGPEVLVYEDVPDPVPGRGEILLKVEAAGVNYVDIMRRRGDPMHEPSPTPFTIGYEMAGVVAGHGPGVDGPATGTPVFVHSGSGAYAQYAVVPAEKAIPIPDGIDAVQMTALWLQGITAALALREAGRLGKGDTVLVEAAAGGLGILTVQLAKVWGAGSVIAAASTPEKVELARSFGADLGVDYSLSGWGEEVMRLTEGRGTDLVIESVGGETLLAALGTLAPFGRLVVLGSASNIPSLVHSGELFNHNRSMVGFGVHQYFPNTELIKSTVAELVELVVDGRLRLQLDHVLPLREAAQTHRLVEERRSTGKVVLQPWA
ncbi:zinc-binding dehydrogenase [Pseudonocardia kujensis]|uniref:quinone oxidoreductase family protein n=1 Tax=Pseudonocardia kujensis TaxID=1128675 RepID=UPI001E50F314|nr:zinc-binding dehydrogenase [Pseudonocardia kujensis]MCE0764106.1 zinc-binding dehydrogenase [Pseudonocardia kujensis]